MIRVLITGGAGYIGSVLTEHLLGAGFGVTVLDNLMYGQRTFGHIASGPHFKFVRGDVRDEHLMAELVKNSDVVVPLAAIVGAPACAREPKLAEEVNVGAIKLLKRFLSPQQLVVFANTNSGYGTKSGASHCTEDTPLEPITLYGQTKVEAERELLERPNTIVLRLATVFGLSPRMRIDLLVNDFVYRAVTDGYLVIFEKDFKRNYVHIRDVADGFLHSINNAAAMAGRPYNLGLDQANLSKEELALKIKEYVPKLYIHFADIAADPDRRNYIVSNARLRQAGFEARRTLDKGIQELIAGFNKLGCHPLKNV